MRLRNCAVWASTAVVSLTASQSLAQPDARGVDVLDVEISQLTQPQVWGREGAYPNGRVGIGMITTSHNVGTVNVDWFDAGNLGETLDNRHPFIGQNVFRERDGRLEQIGLAWMKHGFFSTNDFCDDPGGEFLGVGCFDTYGSFTNASRLYLGPRSEINPLTGYWEPCGSHFDTGEVGYPPSVPGDCVRSHQTNFSPHDNDDHRLRVLDQDVLAISNLGKFFFEGFYIVAGDEDIENNWAHRQIRWVPPDGQTPEWTFTLVSNFEQRPAIDDWGDDVITAQPEDEGKIRVAVRVVPLDATHNRYEYNVYNMNLDRQLGAFAVPVGPGVTLSDFGFHAPVEDEEPHYSTAPWSPVVESDRVIWAPPAPDMGAGEENPNTIRYGTMYTFWFTADEPASDADLALTQHRTGINGPLVATLKAPCSLAPDLNGDLIVDTADLGLLIAAFGTAGPEADLNGDGVVDTADLGLLIAAFGLDCIAD